MNHATELQTVFFSWKLRFIRKFCIQNNFFAILWGRDISKTKCGFLKYDNVITFSFYFELLHILKDGWNENNYKTSWSVWVTWGLRVLIRGYQGHSGASPRSVRVSWGFSEAATATVGEYEYEFLLHNPILFVKYLSPLKKHRNGSVFKICVWISVFRRKKRFVIPWQNS